MSTGTLISLTSLASGLLLAALSLLYTVRHFKLARTVSYIERMNTPEMAEIRGAIDEWLESDEDNEWRLRQVVEDPVFSAKVMVFINIITELGISYEAGLVNKHLTRQIWYPMIPHYWRKLQFFVYEQRRRGYHVGRYLEMMAQTIEEDAERNNLARHYDVPEATSRAETARKTAKEL